MEDKLRKDKIKRIKTLVIELNGYCNDYYNLNKSTVPDKVYDKLLDELLAFETETGCILSNSPTRRVGFEAIDKLNKIKHEVQLLSLDKTKEIDKVVKFIDNSDAMLMFKLDGLTIELLYDDGHLISAATRGDGNIGSDITHNIRAFKNIPIEISYKKKLVITGEGIIHIDDFEKLKSKKSGDNGTLYKNPRNLASGSAKLLNPDECSERCLHFYPFNVQEGLDDAADDSNSKSSKLNKLVEYGFDKCYFYKVAGSRDKKEIEEKIIKLKSMAERKNIPIDGIVVTYDNIEFSQSCGRTEKFYKDGLAFKFNDELFQTEITDIDWSISKNGVITPVAIFETVEIEGGTITRATLSNISNLERLKINIGCRILISRKNMIIPYIEENLDKNKGCMPIPDKCPNCGGDTEIRITYGDNNAETKVLCCTSNNCSERNLQILSYFTSKEVMNIEGLAESKLERLIDSGIIKSPVDLYVNVEKCKSFILNMEGFGEASYDNLLSSINKSRSATLDKFIMAMNIKLIGKTASKRISAYFKGNVEEFEQAVYERFVFTNIEGIGAIMNFNIYNWFTKEDDNGYTVDNADSWAFWYDLKEQMNFVHNSEVNREAIADNPFFQKNIVVTGTLANFTRNTIMQKLESLGAYAKDKLSSNTDYLIAGEKPGSKLSAARLNSVKILTEAEFLSMINDAA